MADLEGGPGPEVRREPQPGPGQDRRLQRGGARQQGHQQAAQQQRGLEAGAGDQQRPDPGVGRVADLLHRVPAAGRHAAADPAQEDERHPGAGHDAAVRASAHRPEQTEEPGALPGQVT